MVNITVLLSVAQIPVVALTNGEKLPVTLPLVKVMKRRADICMYAFAQNNFGLRRRIIVLKRELDGLPISTKYACM